MEWEKQRKEQLMVEKQREYEQLGMMKSQLANLKNELESLVGDFKKHISQLIFVLSSVTVFSFYVSHHLLVIFSVS